MFASVDPIPMVQLITLLGKDYVVWDKSARIRFRRPAKETLFADFTCSEAELADIRSRVSNENEIELLRLTELKDAGGNVICEVEKTIYIADKSFYKSKKRK